MVVAQLLLLGRSFITKGIIPTLCHVYMDCLRAQSSKPGGSVFVLVDDGVRQFASDACLDQTDGAHVAQRLNSRRTKLPGQDWLETPLATYIPSELAAAASPVVSVTLLTVLTTLLAVISERRRFLGVPSDHLSAASTQVRLLFSSDSESIMTGLP